MKASIKTPDQRLRVFVSSTLQELSDERKAAKEAILKLNLIPVMFELGARPYAPRDLYSAYLQQSHIFIGIYWEKYGWVAPDMSISGLEDELLQSQGMPKLLYIKEPSNQRDAELSGMLEKVKISGVSYKTFSKPSELRSLIFNDLAVLLTERFELTMSKYQDNLDADMVNENFPIHPHPIIDREKEVKRIIDMLKDPSVHLLTITGPGGIGKTRISLEIMHRLKLEGQFKISYVPLASVEQADHFPIAILRAVFPSANMTNDPSQLLIDLLKDKKVLLVLDNFEHIINARLYVSRLLLQCPQVKVLVTSRELLNITSEQEYNLAPLSVCIPGTRLNDSKAISGSVQLFVERVRSIHPEFTLDERNYETIKEICTLLDGIPLAIELAAARTRLLSPEQIAAYLKKSFDFLKSDHLDMPARHQTLTATIDWSYQLLTKDEQDLLCKLSVLSAGGTLEAAAMISLDKDFEKNVWPFPRKSFYMADHLSPDILPTETSEVDFLEAAESLLSKSLIQSSVNKFGVLRIHFYQTIKQYCLGKLKEKGSLEPVQFKHLLYYLYFAESNWYLFRSRKAEEVYEHFDNDIYNFESALNWASENQPLLGLRLAVAMSEYWDTRGNSKDTVHWIEKLLSLAHDHTLQYFDIFCIAKFELTRAYFRLDSYDKAWHLLEECYEQSKQYDRPLLNTDVLVFQSLISVYASMQEGKDEIIEKSVDMARLHGYDMALLEVLQHKAADKIFNGRIEEGIHIAMESLELAKRLNAERWMAISHLFLGFGYLFRTDLENSSFHFRQSLIHTLKLKDQVLPVYALLGFCQLAFSQQMLDTASLLFGAINTFIKKPGTSIVPMVMQIHNSIYQQIKLMPSDQWEQHFQEGGSLSLAEAIEIALGPDDQYQNYTGIAQQPKAGLNQTANS